MIRSNLCNYSDAYVHVKGPITGAPSANGNNVNKKLKIVFQLLTV